MSWTGREDLSVNFGRRMEGAAFETSSGPIEDHSARETLAPTAGQRWNSRLDLAIYACLLLFAAALIHSKAVTEIAYSVAMLLWVVKIVVWRGRPDRQPLVAPLLAFLLLSALSTFLSAEPMLSWDRMKSVALLIISMLVAQNVRTLRQVRTLVLLLVLSTLLSVGYNGWLYTYGIGARITAVPPGSPAISAGVFPGDVIIAVNGHRTRTPEAMLRQIRRVDPAQPLRLQMLRGEALAKVQAYAAQAGPVKDELLRAPYSRGHPVRAKGSLGYVVTYAEVLLQLTLLTWGLLLSATMARRRCKWPLALVFILMCATLGATVTRASLMSCAVAGLAMLWICTPRASVRVASLIVVGIMILGAALAVRRERGLGMVAPNDAGTEYRVLMWEDGIRLTREYPLFGVGMDTIKADWRRLNIRAYQRFPLHSHFHSTPIQLAAERGLLTLAAWVVLMALYLRLLWRLRKRIAANDWFSRGTTLGILGATVGFLTSSFVHYNLGDSEVQMLFWFLMGLAIALNRLIPNSECTPTGADEART